MADEARAVFATRDTVPRTVGGGVETALLLDPHDTAGRSAAREIVCDPGATVAAIDGEGAHRYVFVVAGDWTVRVGDEERVCAADTMIQLPAGLSASARVIGAAAGKLLVVTLPTGGNGTLG